MGCACKYFLSLFFLVLAAVSVSASLQSYVISTDEDNRQCEAFCFRALQPLIVDAEQQLEKIQLCDEKDEQIQKLKEQLNAMLINANRLKELENIYNEKIKYMDELNAALSEKSGSEKSSSEKNKSLIGSLSAEIYEKIDAVRVLITQMTHLKSLDLPQNQQTGRLIQEKATNRLPLESFCNGSSSVQSVEALHIGSVSLVCDSQTAGPGWIVVQRRFNGSVDFFRGWSEYRSGFGDLEGEFFMGLEQLHRITRSVPCELYIKLVDFNNDVRDAHYDYILIDSEMEDYTLKSLGTYSGTAGDALRYNLHGRFTTYDRDNDGWGGGNCAKYYKSGWWYNFYANSNLNGEYYDSKKHAENGIWWYNWNGYDTLKSVQIMIRPSYSDV